MAATSEIHRLAVGSLSLDLVPGIGGSVAAFRHDLTDILRPLSKADLVSGNVLGTAMFPMVPYANRISGNAFQFRGKTYRLEANNPPERFNVHGTGWRSAWTIEVLTDAVARMSLSVDDGRDPFRYRAQQLFALDDGGLSVRIGLCNTGAETMPFGFGLHPWFPRDADATLTFNALSFYPEGPDHVALDPMDVPVAFDFSTSRLLPDQWCNNDFGGWGGAAVLGFPARGFVVKLSADPIFRHLMIYADPAQPFYCVEPQTNAAGAFCRVGSADEPTEGVLILEPGQEAEGIIRFDIG
jgi:aldose 1-epimerase